MRQIIGKSRLKLALTTGSAMRLVREPARCGGRPAFGVVLRECVCGGGASQFARPYLNAEKKKKKKKKVAKSLLFLLANSCLGM
jgi:ribosomal protein L37E